MSLQEVVPTTDVKDAAGPAPAVSATSTTLLASAGTSPAGAATLAHCADELIHVVALVPGCEAVTRVPAQQADGLSSVMVAAPNRFAAVWILRQWIRVLSEQSRSDGWLGGCFITVGETGVGETGVGETGLGDTAVCRDGESLGHVVPTLEELQAEAVPDEVLVAGSVAVVATHLMHGRFELQRLADRDIGLGVYQIIEPQTDGRPISDIGWAVRAVELIDPGLDDSLDEALTWIDRRDRTWSMAVNAPTREGATAAAARLALALHANEQPIVYTRVTGERCPIASMVSIQVARSDHPSSQADWWERLQLDAGRASLQSELAHERSTVIHAGAQFLERIVGGRSAVMILDGIDVAGFVRDELDWLLERLSSSDISVLVATHGEDLAATTSLRGVVDFCVTGTPQGMI